MPPGAPLRAEDVVVKKPNQFGKYYLFDRINVGGMAEIYRAKTFGLEGSERLVVVKKMIPLIADDRELVSMFIDEAKLVVQLNHPNIGQVSDWGKVDESYYIAMEYIAGRDLRSAAQRCKQQVIDGSPTMPLAQSCFIVMKLCEALDYAHNKKDSIGKDLGLVHRDVSPANVMISFEGEVKLIDFGVAKIESVKRQETEAGVLKGKFGYLSPEQVRGEKLDRRSDIFSTGIVLYELLTAERLFPPDNDLAVLDRIKNVEVLPPTAYNRKIPEELERIVMKALAPAVADRYQTAMDLHGDLQAFLYTSGEFFSRKELAAWMKRVFRAEFEQEQLELDAVREFRAAAPPVSGGASEPLARARATMSMAALRVPEPSSTGRSGSKETGAILALGPKQTGTVRALGADSAAPSSWTPSNVKTRKHSSKPPPTPRPSVQSITEAASSMARGGEPARPAASRSGSAIPKVAPPPRPGTGSRRAEGGHEEDTTVDGPLAGGRLSDPKGEAVGAASRAFLAASPASAYEGDTRAYAPQSLDTGPDAGDAETRAFGQFPADLAEGGPTIAVPPSEKTPVSASPAELPAPRPQVPVTNPRPPAPRPEPVAPAAPAAEPLQSRAVPITAPPPQLAVPQTMDLGPAVTAAVPRPRSAVPLVLLLLMLVGTAAGGVYWFVLRAGELIIVAEPGRELAVVVDSRPVPLTESPVRLQLKPGGHSVRIEHSGHAPWSESLNIAAGETLIRNIRMESSAPKTGGFTLVSDPVGAAASLDGASLGQVTPMRVQSVVAGPHTLELRLGNRMWRQQINVEPGKLLEVKATLPPEEHKAATAPATETPPDKAASPPVATAPDKTPPPSPPPPATNPPADTKAKPVAEAPRPEPKRPTPPRPKAPKLALPKAPVPVATGNFGYLRVNSKPWTKIIVDGVDTGLNTPQTSYRLTPGTHKLTLFNPQFNIKETFTITLNAGETQTVIKDFLK
jgi:serine/threonine protein kinase